MRDRLQQLLAARKRAGYIRECHGDVHLGNMALLDDKVVLFDCLEFNDNLRWIDVMNEVAFTVMDLDAAGPARPAIGPVGDAAKKPRAAFSTPISNTAATTPASRSCASIRYTARWCAPRCR